MFLDCERAFGDRQRVVRERLVRESCERAFGDRERVVRERLVTES